MPRADHYPPDIMDRYAAFISAVCPMGFGRVDPPH